MDFDRELQKHVRVIHDPVVAGYLNDLGQKIVRQIEPQPFIYRFRVIDDPSAERLRGARRLRLLPQRHPARRRAARTSWPA